MGNNRFQGVTRIGARKLAVFLGSIGLAALALPAIAVPTKAEVAQARAECFGHLHQLKQLKPDHCGRDTPEAIKVRADAEQSCANAESLMVAIGMEKPSAQPQGAPPPPPTLTIVESAQLAEASFASMSATPCH